MEMYDTVAYVGDKNSDLIKLVADFTESNLIVTEIFRDKNSGEMGAVTSVTILPLDIRVIYTLDVPRHIKYFAEAMLKNKEQREQEARKVTKRNKYNHYSNESDEKVIELIKLIAAREATFINRCWEEQWDIFDGPYIGTIYTLVEGGWYDMVVPRKLFDENNYDSLNRSTCQRRRLECIDVHDARLYKLLLGKFSSAWVMVPTICTLVGLDPTEDYTMLDLENACTNWLVVNRLLPEFGVIDRYDEYDQVVGKSLGVKSKRANTGKFTSKPKSKNINRSRIADLLID